MKRDERRPSTIIRDNHVHVIYHQILNELGDLGHIVSKSYIYEKIHERTGLCTKTISHILNHTEYTPENTSHLSENIAE